MKSLAWILLMTASAAALPAVPTNFTGDDLAGALTKDLAKHFELDGDLQLELLQPWTAPDVAAEHWNLAVLEYPVSASANMMVRVRLQGDGRTVADTSLILRASLWKDAWFAREPIASGTAFDPSLLTTQKVDVFRQRDALPATAGDAGLIFGREIQAERMLTWHDIARRPLVHKGEMVEVVASEGRLFVSMKAIALENGARGDLVTVRNLESLKNISGQVVGADRVQVTF